MNTKAWPTGKCWLEQTVPTQFWRWIAALAVCWASLQEVQAAPKTVLFYGPTFKTGGVGEVLVNSSSEFYSIGQGSEIWTPGDPVAAKDWLKKTTAEFAVFDAIVIGDLGVNDSDVWTAAILAGPQWGPAANGNILIFGGDPENHASSQTGAAAIIQNGIRYAADVGSATHTTGLFIVLSQAFASAASSVDEAKFAIPHLLEPLGQFTAVYTGANTVRKAYSHPVLDCVSETALSMWMEASHQGFTGWPSGYLPLAVVTDSSPDLWSPAWLLPAGVQGTAYVLAKGTFSRFLLSPVKACLNPGQTHTVTATLTTAAGQPISGISVGLAITAGPNVSKSFSSQYTSGSGTVTWTYVGSGGLGRDTLVATANTSTGCDATAQGIAEWAPRVDIAATDAVAAEATIPNNGSFTITRAGSTAAALTVNLVATGTAQLDTDYALDWDFGGTLEHGGAIGTVTFGVGQSAKVLTVVPVSDGQSEVSETVILRIAPDPATTCTYSVGDPEFRTVNIASAELSTVTLLMVDSTLDESGNNPGKVRLRRNSGTGSVTVNLALTGTASYGVDYQLDVANFDGTVTIAPV